MTSVLISQKHRNNISDLAQDPIVLQMYKELIAFGYKVKEEYDQWPFMQATHREYTKRGGKQAFTIGAVAAAMLEIESHEVKLKLV